jgi:hypothetical protein
MGSREARRHSGLFSPAATGAMRPGSRGGSNPPEAEPTNGNGGTLIQFVRGAKGGVPAGLWGESLFFSPIWWKAARPRYSHPAIVSKKPILAP